MTHEHMSWEFSWCRRVSRPESETTITRNVGWVTLIHGLFRINRRSYGTI